MQNMKNTIILILFVLFCLVISYLVACIGAWILSLVLVYAFGVAWPNIWIFGFLVWFVVGAVVGIKNYLK